MDMKTEINSSIKKALSLKDEEKYNESSELIKKIILNHPNHSKILPLKVVLSGNYYNLKEYKKSIDYSTEVLSTGKKSELSSLLIYLSYIELNQPKNAFDTLFCYLENHPANLFKDTLEELLDGLLDGFGLKYKDKIIYFANKNNIGKKKDDNGTD